MNTESCGAEKARLVSLLTNGSLYTRFLQAFKLSTGCALHPVTEERFRPGVPAVCRFLTEFRVPVLLNGRALMHLQTAPFRIAPAAADGNFEAVASGMLDAGCSAEDLRTARFWFDKAPAMSAPRAQAAQTLLELFALQLGDQAERLFLQTNDDEPGPVKRARNYILNHLDGPLALEEVAGHAGVSEFYFCKLFKRATGLTFTEFVNRARVEQAKRLLLRPHARVTEVAYDVGYQSLSQFNRSFRRLTEQSPTEYRASHRVALQS